MLNLHNYLDSTASYIDGRGSLQNPACKYVYFLFVAPFVTITFWSGGTIGYHRLPMSATKTRTKYFESIKRLREVGHSSRDGGA